MIDRDTKHTKEHQADNKKVVTVGGEKKLLLFDNEELETSEQISETELQEMISWLVSEALEEMQEDSKPLYEAWLDEADYPEGFSLETFKSLPSFKKRATYAREHLGRLGGGSARIVFAVDPNTVVKIANNKKGQAQNEIEADVSRIGYENIAEVKDYDSDDYLYIEAERARKMTKSDWKRLTGWNFEDWANTLHNFMTERRGGAKWMKRPVPSDFEEIEESELFNNVVTMMADFDMPAGDIGRISSWGIVNRDGKEVPVLVDYGLTQTVWDEYYSPKGPTRRY